MSLQKYDNDIKKYFAFRLDNLMVSNNVTNEKLAEELGTTAVTVSNWRRQQFLPDFPKGHAICCFFNVKSDYFFKK